VSKSKEELEEDDEEENVQKMPLEKAGNTATNTAPIASKIIQESVSNATPAVSTSNTAKEVESKPIPQVKAIISVEPIVTKSPEMKKSSKVTEPKGILKKKASKPEILSGNAKKSIIDKKKTIAPSLKKSKINNKSSKSNVKKNDSKVNKSNGNSKKKTSESSKKK
jgi:hypothetical protein